MWPASFGPSYILYIKQNLIKQFLRDNYKLTIQGVFMTAQLSRKLIRRLVLLEVNKKLKLDVSSEEFDVPGSNALDIDADTKVPKRSLNDLGLPSIEIEDTDDRDDDEILGLSSDEEASETESQTYWNPVSSVKFNVPDDRPSIHDPRGRTPKQIRTDVHATADEFESRIPKKKSTRQKESDFIEEMERLLKQKGIIQPGSYMPDPEFDSTPSIEDTAELPRKDFGLGDDDPTLPLNETVRRLIRQSIRRQFRK